jgi:hypothetical protein
MERRKHCVVLVATPPESEECMVVSDATFITTHKPRPCIYCALAVQDVSSRRHRHNPKPPPSPTPIPIHPASPLQHKRCNTSLHIVSIWHEVSVRNVVRSVLYQPLKIVMNRRGRTLQTHRRVLVVRRVGRRLHVCAAIAHRDVATPIGYVRTWVAS